MLLSRIGEHHSFGRLRIMQWSNSVIKSQTNWKKFIIWDCEWGGHLKEKNIGAAAAMTECRIHQAAIRIDELLGRMAEFDKTIDGK